MRQPSLREFALDKRTKKLFCETRADKSESKCQRCGMSINTSVEADVQVAETSKPCVGALDNPAMTVELPSAIDAVSAEPPLCAAALWSSHKTCSPCSWKPTWCNELATDEAFFLVSANSGLRGPIIV